MSHTEILEALEKVSVKNEKSFDPKEYFKTRDGLYIWSSFNDRVLDKAEPVKAGKEFTIAPFKLLSYSTDEAIESQLPKEHLFSESDVCAVIADLIEKQPKGEEGALINNGYANIFYTKAFVVLVGWGGAKWDVDAWGRGGGEWGVDFRVFSPAN